jgi:hypothetical protein
MATHGTSKTEGVPLAAFGADPVDTLQISSSLTLKLTKRLTEHFGDGLFQEVGFENRFQSNLESIQGSVDIPPKDPSHSHEFFVGLKKAVERIL